MSIRRKSCDPCFAARRKCDLSYPVCERCQKNNKKCHYVYPPQLPWDKATDEDGATMIAPATGGISSRWTTYPGQLGQNGNPQYALLQLDRNGILQLEQVRHLSIPRRFSHINLGDLPPVSRRTSATWVFDRIGEYPLAFARRAETEFIHRSLHRNSFPRPLRAAFGICAACVSMTESNRSLVFRALDSEMSELLTPVSTNTLPEDLVNLQAILLFQIIRLFYGGLEQRIVAERQEYLIRSCGLSLLRRADAELRDAQQNWETWILAESIRRTVLVAFKLYTIYSSFMYSICSEIEAVHLLPVSTKPGSWKSRNAYLQYPKEDQTMTHQDFSLRWAAAPRRNVEPFEKLLLVGCNGIDHFEALIESLGAVE